MTFEPRVTMICNPVCAREFNVAPDKRFTLQKGIRPTARLADIALAWSIPDTAHQQNLRVDSNILAKLVILRAVTLSEHPEGTA